MPDDLALVDTNVLVYAHLPESEQHQASRSLLDRAQAGQVPLCVVSQVLAEFYSIVTNARRVEQPRQPAETLDAIDRLLRMPGMTVLPTPADLLTRLLSLLQQFPAVGAEVFDYQLAAAMLGHGVTRIYTFNTAHFERFPDLEVLEP